MTETIVEIKWPAILKYSNDPELLYISNQSEWNSDVGLHNFIYEDSDYLIDSSGNMFSLTHKLNSHINPQFQNRQQSLEEILGLVKAHSAQLGNCCVAKLYAPSIEDAFDIVKSFTDESS